MLVGAKPQHPIIAETEEIILRNVHANSMGGFDIGGVCVLGRSI
jgi:hypothetical protein